jgi:nucleoside phosphorylase/DNA-binding NarL/FixJ family response regulator
LVKILIIDDDSEKIKALYTIFGGFEEIKSENIQYEMEIKNGIKKLSEGQYDLLILDIQLPDNLGDCTNINGGINLLSCINNLDRIKKPSFIIGLTSHDDSIQHHEEVFQNQLWGLLRYSTSVGVWRDQIRSKIQYLIKWKSQLENSIRCSQIFDYDFAIITAVEREYKSVLALNAQWKETIISNDGTNYMSGIIAGKNRKYRLVVAQQHQMGMPAAGVLSMKLINNFRPKYLCMLGVAAGTKERVSLGDVIIAAESWDYGSGKMKETQNEGFLFEPDPHQIPIDTTIKEAFLRNYDDVLLQIRQRWNASGCKEIAQDIKIHVGALASGAAVVQDEGVVRKYIDPHYRKLMGIDMETYAVYYAAVNSPLPQPRFFSIKTVCDFADKSKNDDYQPYACFVSSQLFAHLVAASIFDD